MDNTFSLANIDMLKLQTSTQLRECNDYTLAFGLSLTEVQIQNLVEKRFEALKDTERIEFGQGILKKLIYAFCDSPYITCFEYGDIIADLQDSFYFFKNESNDLISDDELVELMKKYFDTVCEGSLDYLNSISLEELCRNTRDRKEINYDDSNENEPE